MSGGRGFTEKLRLRMNRLGLDTTMAVLLLIPILVFTAFLIAPLATVVVEPLSGPYKFWDLFRDPAMTRLDSTTEFIRIGHITRGNETVTVVNIRGFNFGVIVNTLLIATVVTINATIIGIIVAFVLSRYDFPGKLFFRILAVVPMLFTPFINAFVISKFFNIQGVFNYLLDDVLGLNLRVIISGMAGVIMAQTMMFWPLAYLNVFASMAQIDPSLEEQAENLGSRGFHLFRKVTLPLSLPGIAAGAAIVFIFSMEDLAAPLAFRFQNVISVQVLLGIKKAVGGSIAPETAALALLLLSMALAVFLSIRKYVSLRQYAMMQKGGRWKPRVRRLGPRGLLAVYLLLLPWMIFSAIPQIGVFIYAFSETWTGPLPEGFTLDNFRVALVEGGEISRIVLNAFKNSVTYALVAVAGIVLLSLTTAYVVSRLRLPGISLLDALATSPIAIPGLAIATGYLLLFSSGPFRDPESPLYMLNPLGFGPALLFIIAYMVRRSPFATRAVFAGLQQTHVSLEEAAMNLGARRLTVLRRIVVPLVALNLLSGILISFVYSVAEVSVSVSLGGLKQTQAPLTFVMYDFLYGTTKAAAPHIVAVMALMIMGVQLAVITLVNMSMKQRFAIIGV